IGPELTTPDGLAVMPGLYRVSSPGSAELPRLVRERWGKRAPAARPSRERRGPSETRRPTLQRIAQRDRAAARLPIALAARRAATRDAWHVGCTAIRPWKPRKTG